MRRECGQPKVVLYPLLSAGLLWVWDSFTGRGSPHFQRKGRDLPGGASQSLVLKPSPRDPHLGPGHKLFTERGQFRGPPHMLSKENETKLRLITKHDFSNVENTVRKLIKGFFFLIVHAFKRLC